MSEDESSLELGRMSGIQPSFNQSNPLENSFLGSSNTQVPRILLPNATVAGQGLVFLVAPP